MLPGVVSGGYSSRPWLDWAGLPPIRLYDFRHTAASLWGAAGVPIKVVSEWLGHSSIVLTADTYSHVFPAMHADALDKVEAMLSAAK